jgi:hypothetical protein
MLYYKTTNLQKPSPLVELSANAPDEMNR